MASSLSKYTSLKKSCEFLLHYIGNRSGILSCSIRPTRLLSVTQQVRLYSASADQEMNSLDVVVNKLKKLAPLSLAGSWDNVGLLVEPSAPKYISKIMLTNDLTSPVMEEAKEKTVDLIISYHPPIFAPMKRLTQNVWKERLIIECMENRIAVFSPHTSYDAVEGGVNDWLISAFDIKKESVSPTDVTQEYQEGNTHVLEVDVDASKLKDVRNDTLMTYLPEESRLRKNKEAFTTHNVKTGSSTSELWRLRVECNQSELTDMMKGLLTSNNREKYSVSPLAKVPRPATGAGRKAELKSPITLEVAIGRVKKHLGLEHVSVARLPGKQDIDVETVAVCAGSGASVLRGVKADLLLTGEMSHHEVLDAIHNGSNVILCHHSNTERGYLKHLKDKLTAFLGPSLEIFVSETDKDPLEIV